MQVIDSRHVIGIDISPCECLGSAKLLTFRSGQGHASYGISQRRAAAHLGLPRRRGSTSTRADAERECLSAIAFALEGDPQDYDTDAETVTLDLNVAPAA
jgi:hypothetical protein